MNYASHIRNYTSSIAHYALCISQNASCITHYPLRIMDNILFIAHYEICIANYLSHIIHYILCMIHDTLHITHHALLIMHNAIWEGQFENTTVLYSFTVLQHNYFVLRQGGVDSRLGNMIISSVLECRVDGRRKNSTPEYVNQYHRTQSGLQQL